MTITRQQLRDWDACYTDEQIAALVPAEGLTLAQILELPIPAADRRWVATRPGVLTEAQQRNLARRIALRALAREQAAGRTPDTRLTNAADDPTAPGAAAQAGAARTAARARSAAARDDLSAEEGESVPEQAQRIRALRAAYAEERASHVVALACAATLDLIRLVQEATLGDGLAAQQAELSAQLQDVSEILGAEQPSAESNPDRGDRGSVRSTR